MPENLRHLFSHLRSGLARNIISNYFAVIWLALLSFGAIPIYVHALGRTGWAVVASSLAVQAFLTFLDAGFSQVMPRYLAHESDSPTRMASIYDVFLKIYVVMGAVGFIVGEVLSSTLAHTWFKAGAVSPSALELGLRIVLIQLLFQLANSANLGYWNGVLQQSLANKRQCFFMTAKHAIAILLIFFVARSPNCYLMSFAGLSGVEFFVNNHTIRRQFKVAGVRRAGIGSAELRSIVCQALSLSIAVLVGTLVNQIDRIVLSKTQDVSDFGVYVIVVSLALASLQLQSPLVRAFLPRVSLETKGQAPNVTRTTLRFSLSVLVFCVVPCLLVSAMAPLVLKLWLHNDSISAAGTSALRLLMIAMALNAIYNIAYVYMIAISKSVLAVFINLACMLAALTVVYLVGTGAGIALGGMIWIVTSATQVILGGIWFFATFVLNGARRA